MPVSSCLRVMIDWKQQIMLYNNEKKDATGKQKTLEEIATEKGCIVVRPSNHQIFVDLDTREAFEIFKLKLEKLNEIFKDNFTVTYTVSKSNRLHAYLHFHKPQRIEARLALQAVLGSDPVREMLSLWNWSEGNREEKDVTVFFEKQPVIYLEESQLDMSKLFLTPVKKDKIPDRISEVDMRIAQERRENKVLDRLLSSIGS